MWHRAAALEFLSTLWAPLTVAGWHCALTGSVLYRGDSTHDLDVVVYPHHGEKVKLKQLHSALRGAGMHRHRTWRQVQKHWRKVGSTDTKMVEVWMHRGRRVDVIIWPGGA